MYTLVDDRLEINPTDSDLGILVCGKLKESQQHALEAQKANCTLGCITSTATTQGKGLSNCALCCAVRLHLQHWGQVLVPLYKEGIKPLESIQRKAMKVVNVVEDKVYEEQLRSLCWFSPEQRS